MAFQATTLQLLISCPGDVEQEDLAAVRKAITRWNVLHGEAMEHVVVPVHWSDHASAEFGRPPQTIVNDQLVSVVDVGIALFWGRLGTPTADAASGTAEEIIVLHDAGKPVSVLRCTRPLPARGDHAERGRLAEYFRDEIEPRGLVVDYDSAAALEQQVDTMLTRLVRRHENSIGPAAAGPARRGGANIVARTEREQVTRRNSKGQAKDSTKYRLILENTGANPARDITWQFAAIDGENDDLPQAGDGGPEGTVPVISGGASTTETIHLHMGTARRFLCRVTWRDGEHDRDTETTLVP